VSDPYPEFDFRSPCPPWCIECDRERATEAGFVVHSGALNVVTHCGSGARPAPATVRPTHFDKLPEAMNRPSTDENDPLIEIEFAFEDVADSDLLRFTPAQARELAAALVVTADLLDPPTGERDLP
jgi:hypothetical protein